jgi:predicted RNA-binding protein (virulence factor B family)
MVHPSGKIDLRLDPSGYKRVLPLRTQIVKMLEAEGGKLEFDDDSSPILIRAKFSVSKNAFKAALGALYKARRIRFTKPGIELVDNSQWAPGGED